MLQKQQLKALQLIFQSALLGGTAVMNVQFMMVSSKHVPPQTLVQSKVPSIAKSKNQLLKLRISVLKITMEQLYLKKQALMLPSVEN